MPYETILETGFYKQSSLREKTRGLNMSHRCEEKCDDKVNISDKYPVKKQKIALSLLNSIEYPV